MSNFSRKEFIKLSSWGIIATIMPIEKISAISRALTPKVILSETDFEQAKIHAAEAKVAFYNKDYARAETEYSAAIALAPAYINFYDGLDNVYGAQRKGLESVILFKVGLSQNPSKTAFYDRAARSLMRLELGHKVVAAQYRFSINSASLLADAKILYLAAIAISNRPYLTKALNKIQYKIDTNAATTNYNTSPLNKLRRKQEKAKSKDEIEIFFDSKNDDAMYTYIAGIDTKPRQTLYSDHDISLREKHTLKLKKKCYRTFLKRNLEPDIRFTLVNNLFNLDIYDSTSFKLLKKEYYHQQKFAEFVPISVQYSEAKQTIYSTIGVMDAVSIALKKGTSPSLVLSDAIVLGKDLLLKQMDIDIRCELTEKLAKLYIQDNQCLAAVGVLEDVFTKVVVEEINVRNGLANRMIYTYAQSFDAYYNPEAASQILMVGTIEMDAVDNSSFSNFVKMKKDEIFKDKQILYYFLYTISQKLGDLKKAETILTKLRNYDPLDKFVLKRT